MKWSFFIILNIILFGFLLDGCKKKNPDHFEALNLISQYNVNIPGISDLSTYESEDEFLTVSDTLGEVYVISETGEVNRKLNYKGKDLEGVTYVSVDAAIYVVEEKLKEIVKMDTNGHEILRLPVELDNIFEKHGLEGISFNPVNEHLYLVSEKSPSLLIEMTLTGEVVDSHELAFALDYSAIDYDPLDSSLWILSDESQMLAKCDLAGNPVKQYRTGIKKCEGLVVDSEHSRIYIVSEETGRLYVFSF